MQTKFSEDVIPLSDLKVNPGKVVNHAKDTHRPVLVTSRGRGIAVVQGLRVAVVGVFAQGVALTDVLHVCLDDKPFNDLVGHRGIPEKGGEVPCLVFVPQFVAVQGQAPFQFKPLSQRQANFTSQRAHVHGVVHRFKRGVRRGVVHHGGGLEPVAGTRKDLRLLRDLLRELSRGRHDDGDRAVASSNFRLVQTVLDHGDGKRRRFATTSLGAAEHVAAGADDGNRLRLNGRRLLVLVELDIKHDLRR